MRHCSPLAAGLLGAMAGAGAIYAYNACTDAHFRGMPDVDGCHCWLIGAGGFAVGLLFGLLALFVERLLEPLVARACDLFGRPPIALSQARSYAIARPPRAPQKRLLLARRRAGRSPPLSL